MDILTKIIIGLVILIHCYILYFEMFAWTTKGPKVFKSFPKELFPKTVSMAANQGLYNGFLAAGLIWSLLITDLAWSQNIALFFLGCVLAAGIYGVITVDKKILYVQVIPSVIGIALILLSRF